MQKILLLVGVTGHRDLVEKDRATLEGAVEWVRRSLATRYPHTPLVLLDPLAEGADQLVARVFLRSGARVVASLPLPADLYKSDFSDAASLCEFEKLLEQCSDRYELPLPAGVVRQEIEHSGEKRDAQYANVGIHIARYCHILIALWDGQDSGKTGGTWQIVKFKLGGLERGRDVQRSILDVPETGAVAHIVTPRKSNLTPPGVPYRVRLLRGTDVIENPREIDLGEALERIDRFNRDAAADFGDSPHDPLLDSHELPVELRTRLAPIDALYQAANEMAMRLQARTVWMLRALAGFGVAATCFYRFHNRKPESEVPLVLLFVALGFGWALYIWSSRWRDHQGRYLECRALAEALRVQYFWWLAGIGRSVTEHYLLKQRDMLQWIWIALRGVTHATAGLALDADGGDDDDVSRRLALVRRAWIESQLEFYRGGAARRYAELNEHHDRKVVLLVTGVLLSVVPAVMKVLHLNGPIFIAPPVAVLVLAVALVGAVVTVRWRQTYRMPHSCARSGVVPTRLAALLTVSGGIVLAGLALAAAAQKTSWERPSMESIDICAVTLVACAAALHLYGRQRAFAEHARQYSRMALLFERAAAAFDGAVNAGDIERARGIVYELGCEALQENADWLMLHRDRPLEAPTVTPH